MVTLIPARIRFLAVWSRQSKLFKMTNEPQNATRLIHRIKLSIVASFVVLQIPKDELADHTEPTDIDQRREVE
jgi:hypothetical protein